jgi:hypothetical protein
MVNAWETNPLGFLEILCAATGFEKTGKIATAVPATVLSSTLVVMAHPASLLEKIKETEMRNGLEIWDPGTSMDS